MQRSSLPDLEALEQGLQAVFRRQRPALAELAAIRRRPNTYASTFASEIVSCHFADGAEVPVLCKYEMADGHAPPRGLRYEAQVYRSVLARLDLPKPRFYGVYDEETSRRTWLVIEYLEQSTRLDLAVGQEAIRRAAQWIGRFHASCAGEILAECSSRLRNYDASFYADWRQRISVVPEHFGRVFPWLEDLYAQAERLLTPLASAPATVVHAELFPSNVLIRDGAAHVVDWESAGVGAGEVDLALLTAGPWAPEVVSDCEQHYRGARWPDGPPPGHESALAAARFYVAFTLLHRWLRFPPGRVAEDTWLVTALRSALDRPSV